MARYRPYAAEILLVVTTMIVAVLGFWSIYVDPREAAEPHHHLHLVTTFAWMGLLLAQVLLLAQGRWPLHRQIGLSVLVAGPVLVGASALLTVHSAQSAIASGRPDALIVQNITGTILLGLVLVLAFLFRKRRKVHGAFLMSTLLLFLGPAVFFALIAFAPAYRIEGPETFHRFQQAGEMSLLVNLAIAALMFAKDWRNGWPYLFTAAGGPLAVAVQIYVASAGLRDGLTRAIAAPDKNVTFAVALAITALLLSIVALPRKPRQPALAPAE